MKSILIIHNEIPYPVNGGNIHLFHLIKELHKKFRVTLLVVPSSRDKKDITLIKKYCEVLVAPYFMEELAKENIVTFPFYFVYAAWLKIQRILPFGLKHINNHSYQLFLLRKELKRILADRDFDFIQVENFYLAPVLFGIKTKAIKILDFWYIILLRSDPSKKNAVFKKYEDTFSRIYDVAVYCSEVERSLVAHYGYKSKLMVPNGIHLDYFKYSKSQMFNSLLYVGDLTFKYNVLDLKNFIDNIYPLISSNIAFHIIGTYKPKDFKSYSRMKNVKFHGFIEDIRPYYRNSLFISPNFLPVGGTRVKILTAFSAGSPVITTSNGAEGLNYTDNKNILIANTKKSFAKKIDLLLNDFTLADKISKNARRLVEKEHNWKVIGEKYSQELNSILD